MVEIAIAALILAVGILPVMSTFMSSSRQARLDRNRNYASAVAMCMLERYRAISPKVLKDLETNLNCDTLSTADKYRPATQTGSPDSYYDPKLMREDDLLFARIKTKAIQPDPDFYISEYKDFVRDHFQCYFAAQRLREGSDAAPLYKVIAKVCWVETNTGGLTTGKMAAAGVQPQELRIGTIVGAPFYPKGHEESP